MNFLLRKLKASGNQPKKPPVPSYTLSEIAHHDSATDLWMVIHGKVYDVTKIIESHPGGAEVLFDFAGLDGTVPFDEVGHSSYSVAMLKPMFKGVVKKDQPSSSEVDKLTRLHREDNDNDDNDNDSNNNGLEEDESYGVSRFELDNSSIGESKYWKTVKRRRNREKEREHIYLLNMLAFLALICYLYIQWLKWGDVN